jgi:hypothetical protein
MLKNQSQFDEGLATDSLTYVLNGPIQLFLLKIFMMSVEVDILHNTSMLQD